MEILLESANAKYVKKYPCPYCGAHFDRSALVTHIDKKHEDEIPEGYTPIHVVFDLINKKDHGNCVICGKETGWNHNLARYNRFCSEKCRLKYVEIAKKRMIDTYGKENLLDDPEHQKKMIANRKISGTYKFSTGGEHSYTGSYEKNALEFLDKVMEYKVGDIDTPGPVIEYMYNNKKHFWITDIYIPSYKLCIDVKDGGSNPNNREMKEYREKQIAKENAIIKQGKYNYLRLTNNNFGQLMGILAELKMQLIDESNDMVIRIHENMFSSVGTMMPMGNPTNSSENDVYICNYTLNNIFSNVAVSDDPFFDRAFVITKDGIVKESTAQKIFGSSRANYNVYKYNTNNAANIFSKLQELSQSKIEQENSLLEIIFDKQMYTDDEWICYESVEEIPDYFTYLYETRRITRATLLSGQYGPEFVHINESSFDDNELLHIKEDRNGYFLENKYTRLRTPSQLDIEFSDIQRSIIRGGFL